jgi:hypothetical protein
MSSHRSLGGKPAQGAAVVVKRHLGVTLFVTFQPKPFVEQQFFFSCAES